MPKLKRHKGLAKRVKVTARGKVKHKKPFAGHLMSGKSGRRKIKLRRAGLVADGLVPRILDALCAH